MSESGQSVIVLEDADEWRGGMGGADESDSDAVPNNRNPISMDSERHWH